MFVLFAGVLPPVILQLLTTYSVWGSVVIYTYKGEGFTGGLTGIVGVLASSHHGLFVFHPWYLVLLALNVYGAAKYKSTRYLNIVAITVFVLLWITNGTWGCWLFGASFGSRAFIETLVPLTMGAVAVASQPAVITAALSSRKAIYAAIIFLLMLNMYTWRGFLKVRYDPCGEHSYSDVFLWPLKERPRIVCGEERK